MPYGPGVAYRFPIGKYDIGSQARKGTVSAPR